MTLAIDDKVVLSNPAIPLQGSHPHKHAIGKVTEVWRGNYHTPLDMVVVEYPDGSANYGYAYRYCKVNTCAENQDL